MAKSRKKKSGTPYQAIVIHNQESMRRLPLLTYTTPFDAVQCKSVSDKVRHYTAIMDEVTVLLVMNWLSTALPGQTLYVGQHRVLFVCQQGKERNKKVRTESLRKMVDADEIEIENSDEDMPDDDEYVGSDDEEEEPRPVRRDPKKKKKSASTSDWGEDEEE